MKTKAKTFRTNEESYIDKNYTSRNGDGYNFAKVRIRALRKPTYGDKFSSRHGLKRVLLVTLYPNAICLSQRTDIVLI